MEFELWVLTLILFAFPLLLGFVRSPSRQWIAPKSEKVIPLSGFPAWGLSTGALILLTMMAVMFLFDYFAFGNPAAFDWMGSSLRNANWLDVTPDPEVWKPVDFSKFRIFYAALGALFTMPLCVLFWSFASPDKSSIRLNSNGLQFPWFFLLSLKGRLKRDWADLTKMEIRRNSVLLASFASGGRVKINLNEMSDRDREFVLYTALRLNPSCEFVRDRELDGGKEGQDAMPSFEMLSFTELWDYRLQRQFKATTFVPLSTGENILSSRYSIVQKLATTAFSATYAARDQQGFNVVVKELATGRLMQSSEKMREMFLRECAMLAEINHPQICKILDTFSENDRDYLVLEFIPGKTIRKFHAQDEKPSELAILKIALQMCEILQYLHEQEPPIIHRDVSPDNWIINNEGKVFLIDFGAANTYLNNVTRTVVGKNCYMAPEQVRGKASFESDVYGLGATLYFLISGEDPEALSVCHPQSVDPNISTELDELICNCTCLEASERIQSMADLKLKVEEAIEQLGKRNLKRGPQILSLLAEPVRMFARKRSGTEANHD